MVAKTPGLADTLKADGKKAAHFYARFEITETLFRHGVRYALEDGTDNPLELLRPPAYGVAEPFPEE